MGSAAIASREAIARDRNAVTDEERALQAARAESLLAQAERARQESGLSAAMGEVDSDISNQFRTYVRRTQGVLEGRGAVIPDDELDTMSARALQPQVQAIRSTLGHTRDPRRRGERAPGTLTSAQRDRQLWDGVFAGVDISGTERTKIRDAFKSSRMAIRNMNGLVETARQFEGVASLSSTARSRLESRLSAAMAMVAEVRNTGVINPGEMDSIQAALPNPNDLEQMVVSGQVEERARAWSQLMRESLASYLESRSVPADQIDLALSRLSAGGGSGGGGRGRTRRMSPEEEAEFSQRYIDALRQIEREREEAGQ